MIEENKLVDYYQDYIANMRKGSEDDVFLAESPYMVRKKKNKKFMKKNNRRIGSPIR